MIIRSLQLKNWGVFRDEVKLDLSPGLNVIVGPNESGKSTIREALVRAFFTKHTASTAGEPFVPWGTTGLAPELSMEFETGGRRYRALKRFVNRAHCELAEQRAEAWERVAEADAADVQLAAFLDGELPTRMTRSGAWSDKWGIVQSLWSAQGDLGTVWDPGKKARDRLQAEVGGVITTEAERGIMGMLRKERDDILTPRRDEIKKGSELWEVDKAIEEAGQEVQKFLAIANRREEMAKKLEGLEAERSEMDATLQRAREELGVARKAAEAVFEHVQRRERKTTEAKDLERDWKGADGRVQNIKRNMSEDRKLSEEESKAAGAQKKLEGELGVATERLGQVKQELVNEEQELKGKEKAVTDARIAHTVLGNRSRLTEMERALSEAERLDNKRADLIKELEGSKDITDKDLRTLEKIEGRLERTRGMLDAQGLTLTLSAQKGIKGELHLDDEGEPFTLAKGKRKEWKASQKVRLSVPGVMGLEVMSGAEDVKGLRGQVTTLEDELRTTLASYGVKDRDGLRSRFLDRKRKMEQVSELEERVADHASKGIPTLRSQLSKLRASIASDTEKITPETRARKLAASEDIEPSLEAAASAIVAAERERDVAKEAMGGLRQEEEQASATVQGFTALLNELGIAKVERDMKLKQLREDLVTARDDGLEDGARVELRKQKAALLAQARDALEVFEAEKVEMEVRPKKALETAQGRVDDLQKDIETLIGSAARLRGSLEQLVGEGDYTELATVEERLTELERRGTRLRLDMDAIVLLLDLLGHHQKELSKSMAEPIRSIVDMNMKRLIGTRYGGIELDDDLVPRGVRLEGLDEVPDLESLSHGTREQLGMLVRLAFGEVLSRKERLPVILDDPLAHTDTARRIQALEILRESAERLQVIILTCHPEDYAGLVEANRIELGGAGSAEGSPTAQG